MDKPRIIAVANRGEERPPNLPAPALTDLEKSVLERMVDRGEMTPEEYEQETGEKPTKKTTPPKDTPQPTQTPEPVQTPATEEPKGPIEQPPAQTELPTEPAPAPEEPKEEPKDAIEQPAVTKQPATPTPPIEDSLTEADLDKDGEELAEEIDDKPRIVSQTTPREREVKEIDEIARENASRDIAPVTRNVEQPLTYSTDEEKARAVEQAKRLYAERRKRSSPWHALKRIFGMAKE
ncbi:hypothetical protein AUJ14_04575 [Candidatus Micrarchaeota archaeon CG1_02_55_22]|nr:MAG: hypothetical protein AUJ14_04575 [Candidatus Micrarchaeota archaeon CG1_02_55_22]